MCQLTRTLLAGIGQLMLISSYTGYFGPPYALHLSPNDSWFQLKQMTVNCFLDNRSICYWVSFMLYLRNLHLAITGCVWLVVPALEILLRYVSEFTGGWQQIWWQQQPIHGWHLSWALSICRYHCIQANHSHQPQGPATEQEQGCGGLQMPSDGI